MLREDTDLKHTPTAMQQVLDDLRWLGMDWDEGPDVGGPHGPYLQSERREIYDKYIQQLLDAGKAYYCFDTTDELLALRDKAEADKAHNLYPRPERFPDAADVANARAEGRPVTVRFAVDADEPIVIDDIIRGQVSFDPAQIGDFVIQKSDGFPTYHFAVVVDDELMGVTHVIRGQEHLMNTPNHQLLQKGLGFRIPQYAHLSVTVSETGGKLSKRERPKALVKAIKAAGDVDSAALAAAGAKRGVGSVLDGKHAGYARDRCDGGGFGVHLPEIMCWTFPQRVSAGDNGELSGAAGVESAMGGRLWIGMS